MSYNDGEDNRPLPGALPCPFCGGSNIATYAGSTFRWRYAACNECSAQASEVRIETISLPRDKAIEVADRELLAAWNTRAARPEVEPTKEQRQAISDLLLTMRDKMARGEEINWLAMPHEIWRALREGGSYVPVPCASSPQKTT